MSGVFAAFLFVVIRALVLRKGDLAYDRTFKVFPVLVFVTFTVNIIFILEKGGVAKGNGLAGGGKIALGTVIGIGFGCGAALGLLTLVLFNPLMRKVIDNMSEEDLNTR
jgi:hypothetical protein